GSRILYATAADARDVLPNGLRSVGATVDVVPIYRSVADETSGATLREAIDAGEVDVVTFAAASAVDGYVALVGPDRARRVPAASIGPITTAAAAASGIQVRIEAGAATIDAL